MGEISRMTLLVPLVATATQMVDEDSLPDVLPGVIPGMSVMLLADINPMMDGRTESQASLILGD
jgi:hypothetical protein